MSTDKYCVRCARNPHLLTIIIIIFQENIYKTTKHSMTWPVAGWKGQSQAIQHVNYFFAVNFKQPSGFVSK